MIGERLGTHERIERHVLAVSSVELQREIGGLQNNAGGIGHNRGDYIDELSQVGDFHRVAMAVENVDRCANPKRVAQGVNFFEFVRITTLPSSAEPDVPLVRGDL